MRFLKKTLSGILNFFYGIPRFVIINSYRMTLRIKISGFKKIPREHSAIFAFNHTNGADPFIVLSTIRKKIYFLTDSERFSNRLTSFFMRRFTNSIPVFKKEFNKNFKSFKELFDISKGKKIFFGIFPEGELFKNDIFGKFKNGAAYLSYKTQIPIIPVYLHNLHKGAAKGSWFDRHPVFEGISAIMLNTFRRVHVFIGDPIDPMAENIIEDFSEIADKKEYKKIIDKITAALEKEFNELKDEAESLVNIKEKELMDNGTFKNLRNLKHGRLSDANSFEEGGFDLNGDDEDLADSTGNLK
jgi:1-acyl-sn-glycerol-3-phosphate acyltransferase